MRVRARMTTAAAGLALALVASLSGCVTVHGERAVLPAVSEEDAERVLAEFAEVSSEASAGYDAELNATVENGPLGAIDQAGLTARDVVSPGGNENHEPLEFSDTRFLVPQQAGWPKFFVADTRSSRHEENRWLLVFTKDGHQEDWMASYLTVLPPEDVPDFSRDEEGYAQAVPQGADSGLALALEDLPQAYSAYLKEGEGPFTEGPYTTGVLEARQEADADLSFVMQYEDAPAEKPEFAPLGLRTEDGGALVLFSSLHHEKKTMAEGETPVVDPIVEALMDGSAERSVTLAWVWMQSALVPAENGDTEIRHRIAGVTGAKGQ